MKTHWKEHSFKQGVAHPVLYLVLTPQKKESSWIVWEGEEGELEEEE